MDSASGLQTPIRGIPQRPFRRNSRAGLIAGVCAGVASRLGVSVRSIRLLTVILSLGFGFGVSLYAVLWLSTPLDGENTKILSRLASTRRHRLSVLWLLVAAVGCIAVIIHNHLFFGAVVTVNVIVALAASVLAWLGGSERERAHLEATLSSTPILSNRRSHGWRFVVWRLLPALVLLAVGLKILNHAGGVWSAAIPVLFGSTALLLGVFVVAAPWWLENVRALTDERRNRVRAEERATLATQVHDSVLQTLTLIERVADNPTEVRRLARGQERELRDVLFNPVPDSRSSSTNNLGNLLVKIEREIERDYGVIVELVVVGDVVADESIAEVLGAVREAMRNAAKWSGQERFSVFVEVATDQISFYVRDSGCGFDLGKIEKSRHGLQHSVRERVARLGGTCTVQSAVGSGTEVSIVIPWNGKE